MTPQPHDSRLATESTRLTDLDDAITGVFAAIRPIDEALLLLTELVEAWSDLSFDDRRYLGTSFPRLTNALLRVEDHLK